jgi:hypothetical protein
MIIRGSCHCGNITFRLDWQPDPTEIPARACTCSFCAKHGGVWTSCPTGSLTVEVHDAARHSKYRFGTKTADFYVCARCGAVPFVTSLIGGRLYAVVNVNSFRDLGRWTLHTAATTFDGEMTEGRLERRAQTWIPDVTVREGAT